MAPIKFDEKFREKLEERTITPNEMTWDKLDSKLGKLKKKKNNKPFWWLGLAASFVGVLLISNLFFKANNDTVEPVIVNTENKIEVKLETKKEELVNELKGETELVVNNEEVVSKKKEKINVTRPSTITVPNKQSVANNSKKDSPSFIINTKKEKEPIINNNSRINTRVEAVAVNEKLTIDHFETQKINEVVAKIQELKASKNNITDAEIDALLNKAEQDIFKKRSEENSKRVVDANSLLFEVENELEQSFRDRVFETIKSGYKTVRTAVVERKNN